MRLRERGTFSFRTPPALYFDLSYQAPQSGRQQPAIHTVPALPDAFVARGHVTLADLARPAVPMGAPFSNFLFDTLHDHVDRRLFSCLPTCPNNVPPSFSLSQMYLFFSHVSNILLLFKGVVCTE